MKPASYLYLTPCMWYVTFICVAVCGMPGERGAM